jgi:D-glycero-alpha-D-manno-heptose-7-phosphate kinase
VGVLNALSAYAGQFMSAEALAAAACRIEIGILGKPIGKQDQYLAAYGGLKFVRFNPDESVEINPIICPATAQEELVSRLMLFYTGIRRSADTVLSQARHRIRTNGHVASSIERMVWLADDLRAQLIRGQTDRIGPVLDRAWQLKKQMGSRVTNDRLDRYYARALAAGSDGGKVLGAGGGGCILLSVPSRAHRRVRAAMQAAGLSELPFRIEPEGSKIIYVGG